MLAEYWRAIIDDETSITWSPDKSNLTEKSNQIFFADSCMKDWFGESTGIKRNFMTRTWYHGGLDVYKLSYILFREMLLTQQHDRRN